jgi:predicted SnoaL-like aldol condensation-catalyzing enzyme
MQETIKSDLSRQDEANRKRIAVDFLNLLGAQKFKEGLRYFTPDCKTHNPYIVGGMDALTDAMITANKDMRQKSAESELSIKQAIAEGDLVAVHTELLNMKGNPAKWGLRQVHLFRFEGDKIVEYWDISQLVTPELPNAAGAFWEACLLRRIYWRRTCIDHIKAETGKDPEYFIEAAKRRV